MRFVLAMVQASRDALGLHRAGRTVLAASLDCFLEDERKDADLAVEILVSEGIMPRNSDDAREHDLVMKRLLFVVR